MVNCSFGLVVWDSNPGTGPKNPNPFHFRGSFRNPNHRAPNQYFTMFFRHKKVILKPPQLTCMAIAVLTQVILEMFLYPFF